MEIIIETFQISCIVSNKTSKTHQKQKKNTPYELEEEQKKTTAEKKHIKESNWNHYYVNQNLWTQLVKFVCNSDDDDVMGTWQEIEQRKWNFMRQKCLNSNWRERERENEKIVCKNQINSIRDRVFNGSIHLGAKKSLRFCLAIECCRPSHTHPQTPQFRLWDKQKSPTEKNKCQVTDYLGTLREVCTRLVSRRRKVKLKVNVIWCLSISRSFLYLSAFIHHKKISHKTPILWFKMNLR